MIPFLDMLVVFKHPNSPVPSNKNEGNSWDDSVSNVISFLQFSLVDCDEHSIIFFKSINLKIKMKLETNDWLEMNLHILLAGNQVKF